MLDIILSASRCQAVRCVAEFSLADHLANGPKTAEAIAYAEGLNAEATFRLMRACTSFGLMTYDSEVGFSATPLLNTLRRDDQASLRSLAVAQLGRGHWLPWERLPQAIRTGKPQTRTALGVEGWEFYQSESGAHEAEAFTQSMKVLAEAFAVEAARLVSTVGVDLALDVGGASGTLVHALMEAKPDLHGAVLDLAHVIPSAEKAAEAKHLQDRFRVFPGNFLQQVPPADLYLLKSVLHDWADEACLVILQNCRRATAPGGRLILAEIILDETVPSAFGSIADLTMLAMLGGRERTFVEYDRLLGETGFLVTGTTVTVTPFSLIEAVAI